MVSIVGFLTAIAAFGIVRLEQWLFDIKEGYCGPAWYKAKRFCCPVHVTSMTNSGYVTHLPFPTTHLNKNNGMLTCADWVTWAQKFNGSHRMPGAEEWMIEYSVYILFAVRANNLHKSTNLDAVPDRSLASTSFRVGVVDHPTHSIRLVHCEHRFDVTRRSHSKSFQERKHLRATETKYLIFCA